MDTDDIKSNEQKLQSFLVAGKYREAELLCQVLWQRFGKLRCSTAEELAWKVHIGHVYGTLIGDRECKEECPAALEMLECGGDNPFSVFLRLRLYWIAGKLKRALDLLNKYYRPDTSAGEIKFPADSYIYRLSQPIQVSALVLMGKVYNLLQQPDLSIQCHKYAMDFTDDFDLKATLFSSCLFKLHYINMSARKYYEKHILYNDFCRGIQPFEHTSKEVSHKIRIGYISPDLKEHVVLSFVWPMLTEYDKERFEVYCYCACKEDKYSKYVKSCVDKWANVESLKFADRARLIYEDKIDILVDLAGHTSNTCLPVLAYKPAPVQMCGIGYFATTGLSAVDYFLTDKYLVNECTQNYFSEKLLVLPHSHFCYKVWKATPAVHNAPCIKNGYITFGSFNNLSKVNEDVIEVWSRILKSVPKSRLFLKGKLLGEAVGREIIYKKFQKFDIDTSKLDLRGSSDEYMSEYLDIDIALDTFPYPGGGTTCDALYMGVPVISYGDGSHGGNFGISILKNIGLTECCCYSLDEYVDKAVALATDFELLDALHRSIRTMMENSPVMDSRLYMHDIESAYTEIYNKWMAGKAGDLAGSLDKISIKETDCPLVSIMIPTYNRPELFEKTLQSAISQDYPNMEILVNDNSTNEETAVVIAKYLSDCRVKYNRQAWAKSKADNFSTFQQLAQGEYLQWCMDDDVLGPHKISLMAQVLDKDASVSLVTSQRGFIDENGNILGGCGTDIVPTDVLYKAYDGRAVIEFMLRNCNNLIGEPSAVLFRRQDLQNHYWHADCRGYKVISDVAMWLELLERGNLFLFREPLSYYRRHGGQEGQRPEVILRGRLEWLQLLGEYYAEKQIIPKEIYEAGIQALYDDYQKMKSLQHYKKAENFAVYTKFMETVNKGH